jgi:hypothetical protein
MNNENTTTNNENSSSDQLSQPEDELAQKVYAAYAAGDIARMKRLLMLYPQKQSQRIYFLGVLPRIRANAQAITGGIYQP